MARFVGLEHLDYRTWGALSQSLDEMGDALRDARNTVDALEGAIAHEHPTPAAVRAARDALAALPAKVDALAQAVGPTRIEVLRRRALRVEGEKMRRFGSRA